MKNRTASKIEVFADEHHRKTLDTLGESLSEIESLIDFAALSARVCWVGEWCESQPTPTQPAAHPGNPSQSDGST